MTWTTYCILKPLRSQPCVVSSWLARLEERRLFRSTESDRPRMPTLNLTHAHISRHSDKPMPLNSRCTGDVAEFQRLGVW